MFLPRQEILRHFPRFIEGGREEYVREICYDLRVGDEVYRSEERLPDRLSADGNPYVIIAPGQFALVKTLEIVKVPDEYVGFIAIRSEYKFQGLVNVSGFHVDPTFKGHLLFAVQNVGPNDIRLRYAEGAFMVMWAKLTETYLPPEGARRRDGYPNIPMRLMAQLGGGSITLAGLKTEVDRLHTQVKFFIGIAIALVMAVIGVILKSIFK